MAVNEGLYRKLKDAGFTHLAALVLSDSDNDLFGGHFANGGGGGAEPVEPAPPLYPGSWVYPISQSAYDTGTVGRDYLRVSPFVIYHETPIAALGINLSTAGDEGSVFHAAIFADNGGIPGDLAVDSGPLDVSGDDGLNPYGAVNEALQPGTYWIGGVLQGGTTQPEFRTINCLGVRVIVPMMVTSTESWGLAGLEMGGVTDGLPASFAQTGFTGLVPRVAVKIGG